MDVTKGLLVRLQAQRDKDAEVEAFLRAAVPLVAAEPETIAWLAVRFARSEYGIFDVVPGEDGREAHLRGAVARRLAASTDELLDHAPEIVRLDVLASKFEPGAGEVEQGLLLTWEPRGGHEQEVADFLRGARALVEQEPATVAWFAIRLPGGGYGILGVFPDARGRFAHLTGRVPREIARHATSLLGSVPDMEMLDVVAAKLPA